MIFFAGLGRYHRQPCSEGLALVGVHHHCPSDRDVHPLDTLRGPSQVSQDFVNKTKITLDTRACGVTLLKREKAAWFPAEELRDDNNVQPHKVETDDNNDML